MKKMTSNEIRRTWLDFFKSKGHYEEPSASLIPVNDPTLLWINAGVSALKKYFDGSEIPPYTRITNSQKAIRTNDIENVGKTARHHTFFEMLGNFSIGDYFRDEVIPWAYELLTSEKYFGFDKNLLYITYFPEDLATKNLWIKCGMEESHMIPQPGNFWEIGEGPCGPDTEIFFDRGVKYDPNNIGIDLLKKDMENDRYIEIWNIVFSQFNSEEGKKRSEYKELPSKNIDTGAGLERFACVLQETETNFETDLFYPYILEVEKHASKPYKGEFKMAYRVIADHIRTCTFALSDGAMFANEGRGYVLRRILRRAVRYLRKLGIEEPFLYKLVDTVVENMKDYYPYLEEKKDRVKKMILSEEERFASTLNSGEQMLRKLLENQEELSGADAFKLYDTYGFPIELTEEICEELGKEVDLPSFKKYMKEQKERARNARENIQSFNKQSKDLLEFTTPSEFVYFQITPMRSKVIGLFKNGERVKELTDEGEVVFDRTNFYATSGGQVCDIGHIEDADNVRAVVVDVNKSVHKQHLHSVKIEYGSIKEGDSLALYIDMPRRERIQKNHSACHLLQKALQEVLGSHVHQEGSLNNDQGVRFDFSHYEKMTPVQIREVERIVNEHIQSGGIVHTREMPIDEARKLGAMALFSEKYGDVVRVVQMANSIELCGGTHVNNIADINLFVITSEESIASGIRRIEAKTSSSAYEYLKQKEMALDKVGQSLQVKTPAEINSRINSLKEELALVKKANSELNQKVSSLEASKVLKEFVEGNEKHLLVKRVDNYTKERFTFLFDSLKTSYEDVVLLLANVTDDKISYMAYSSASTIKKGIKAGDIIKLIASKTSGNGGGRPDFAQGGGKDISSLDKALEEVRKELYDR